MCSIPSRGCFRVRLRASFAALLLIQSSIGVCAEECLPKIVDRVPIGRLAFVTSKGFGGEGTIIVTGETTKTFEGNQPAFTPDGNRLLFAHHLVHHSAVHICSLSNASRRVIKGNGQDWESPSLSPSGEKLLFVVWSEGRKTSHIGVCDVNNHEDVKLLTSGDHYDWSPRWSNDGNKIVFESTRDGERQIYVMEVSGQHQMNLSGDGYLSHAPCFSPDGKRIAYMSAPQGQCRSIYVMNADGSQKTNISRAKTRDSEPVWSPDGEWIAFTRTQAGERAGGMDIWVMRSDGSDQKELTHNPLDISSYAPAWAR